MSPDPEVIRARRAISALFLVNGAAIGSWIVHLSWIKSTLQISSSVLGGALLASAIGAVTTMPFAGVAIQRFGSRRTSLFFGVLLLSLIPLIVRATTLLELVIVLFLVGAVNGQMDVGMNAHSVAVQHRYGRPMISSVHGWFSIGGFLGGGGAAYAARFSVGPADHLVVSSVIAGAILLVSGFHLLPASADASQGGPSFRLPTGPLLGLGLLSLFAFLSEGAIWDWAAVYLRSALGTDATTAAVGFALFSLGMAAGRFFGDALVERLGNLHVLQLSGLMSAAGIWLALLLDVPAMAVAGFALAGIGLANTVPILFRAAGSVPGIPAGTGLAAVTTCGYSGFLVGPPFVGYVADAAGLKLALGIMAGLCVVIAFYGKIALHRSRLE